MRYLIGFGLCLLLSVGCASRTQIVGNDRDTHGCIGSAGYTWSDVRQSCIRIFEEGVPLKDMNNPEASLVAYAVFSASNDSVEVYLPEKTKKPILVRRSNCWSNRDYVLCNENGRMCLLYHGQIIYCN